MSESDQHKPQGGEAQLRYPLPTGTRVDHYVIREVLGAGGFGITYLAEHEALGKKYAIKEYFPHSFSYRQGRTVRPISAGDGTYKWGLERFVTEARALARFKHPAIVDVASIFEANGTAYIVLDYESGVDMGQWLKQLGRSPTQEELDRLVAPLLAALEEVHRHNMMHRDISPDNILIRDDGRPVLIDFGSARESIRGRARALSAIVKHGYSPPEQYTSKPELQGPWTDIYALAATLYRAIGARLPPDATERFVKDELVPLARLARAPYRPSFLEAIDRGLKMKVDERPQTIVEWREQLLRPEPLRQPSRPPPEKAPEAGPPAQPAARAAAPRLASQRAGSEAAAAPGSQRAGPQPGAGGAGATPPAALAASGERASAPGAGPSRRISSDGSLKKSERPDLSWLDQADEPEIGAAAAPPPQASIGQMITYAFLGLLGGAILGGLMSIVLASIVSSECFGDRCILRFLPACAALGAIVGAVAGVRLARQSAAAGHGAQLGRTPGP